MDEIKEKISKSLHIPLLIESIHDNMIRFVVSGEDFNNYEFTTFLRLIIKYHLIEKIQYKKNNSELQVSFFMTKQELNDSKLNEILVIIDEKQYEYFDYAIKEITTGLNLLLLGLYSNGIIEYDVVNQNVTFKLEGMDTKVLSLTSAISFIDKLNTNPKFTKKFVNGGNCDSDIASRITSFDEVKEAALAYSEGNESLRELLEFCFSNDIWTIACCKGHSNRDDKSGFVTFNLDYQNTRDFFNFLVKKLLSSNLDRLLLSSNFIPIPGYPTCALHVSKSLNAAGVICYQYDHIDQILKSVLNYGKEFIDKKRNDLSYHRK